MSDDFQLGQEVATFSFELNAQPYKLETRDGGSASCQAWDTFVFATDIFRDYYAITVDGTTSVNVYGNQMPVIPIFEVSGADELKVGFNGKTYDLTNGSNKIYEIVTMPGDNILTFTGKGTVTIRYIGGSL